jgi:hypothetical protein
MSVGASIKPAPEAKLQRVTTESANEETGENEVQLDLVLGKVGADLTGGADVSGTVELMANDGLTYRGVQLIGAGFIVTPDEAKALGLGKIKGLERHIREYRNGRDLTDAPRGVMVIDLFGLSVDDVRIRFPKVYEHILSTVKPERDQNNRASYRDNWWVHGEPRRDLRPALAGLPRFIASPATAKHRIFAFPRRLDLPDDAVIAFTLDDAFHLGVLSSRIHVVYALAAGGTLEDRPRYNNSRCFDPFPFPDCTEKQKAKIRVLAEELDAHRKRAQAKHGLGLTDIYNVLEKVRAGAALTAKDKALHAAALVSTLKQLHDNLDAAVADAYGWPWPLPDAEILERVVALNAARAAEEAQGLIRWLRPDYQKPRFAGTKQSSLALDAADSKPPAPKAVRKAKPAWPKTMAERAKAIESALADRHPPDYVRGAHRAIQPRQRTRSPRNPRNLNSPSPRPPRRQQRHLRPLTPTALSSNE